MNKNRTGHGLVAGALTAAVALALAACSTQSGGDPGGTGTTAPASAPTTRVAASTPKAAGALSGTWSGQYSGAYSGTFTVRWKQSGSRLHGTIHISSPDNTLPINGAVHGKRDQLRHRGLDGDHLFGDRLRQLDVGHLQGQ